MKALIIKEYSRPSKLFLVKDLDLKEGSLDEFKFHGDVYKNDGKFEIWKEVEFKEINNELNFYGAGYDKVTCLINERKADLIESRYKGQDGYYMFEDDNEAAV